MSGRKRRVDDADNSDDDNRKKQARVSNLGSGANSGQSSSALNAEPVAKAPKTTATVASQTVSGEALGTKTAPAEAEQSRDKGKQRVEQVEEPKEAAGGISVNNKESTAGPSTAGPSKQPSVKRQRRKKNDPAPDPVKTAIARIKNNPSKRTDRACNNCRNQKLKCDNNPDGCAPCAKRNIECTFTFANQQTYVRGGPRETERDRDGLNLEVERLRADVNYLRQFVHQEVNLLRQDFNLLREENMQLRRVLEGYRRAYLNHIQLPPLPPAAQAVHNPQYGAYPQTAGQGAAHFPLPTNPPRPEPRSYTPTPSPPPVTREPANLPPAPKTPPPRQGSPYVQPGSTSPYRRTDSQASADNGDTNSGATNNDPAFANQVAPPMTEQGGGQPASTAMSLDVDLIAGFVPQPADLNDLNGFNSFQVSPPMTEQGGGQPASTAMSLGVDFIAGFDPQPADLNDLNGFNSFNGDNGDNGVDPTLDSLMLSVDRDLLLAFNNEPSAPNAANTAGPATEPFTIDPGQLTLPPVDHPQVAGPATTLALSELQNERDNDGPQQD